MPQLTLASFNLHGGVRSRRLSVPRVRNAQPRPGLATANGTYDVVATLKALDVDVLVLQEAWWPDDARSAVEDVADTMDYELLPAPFGRSVVEPWPHFVGRSAGRSRGMTGLAVLSRCPARRRQDIRIGRVVGDPAPFRRALRLELDVDGTVVDLVAVHLTSRLPHGPPLQLWRLRRQLPVSGRPAVVAGDFNFWGPAVTTLLPGWRRAVRGRTWPAHGPHSQIDHVLVNDRVEVSRAEILDDVGSDHRPVRVTLRIP